MWQSGFKLSNALDEAIVQLLYSWDELEQSIGGPEIVDFDLLAEKRPAPAESHWAVLQTLQNLKNQAEAEGCAKTADRLRRQEVFLRNVMGERWAYEDYLPATVGVEATPYAESYLEKLRGEIVQTFAEVGHDFSPEGLADYESSATELKTTEEIKAAYLEIFHQVLPKVERILGFPVTFKLNVEIVQEQVYWANWVSAKGDVFTLKVNFKKDGVGLPAVVRYLACHELVGHAVHVFCQRQEILQGRLPRHVGLTSVHGPESFQQEGIAQAVIHLLAPELYDDPMLRLHSVLREARNQFTDNAALQTNAGKSVEEVVQELHYYLAHEPISTTADRLASWQNNPQFRCYEQAYGPGLCFFKAAFLGLEQEKAEQFLREAYLTWRTPDEWYAAYPEFVGAQPSALPLRV